MNRSPLLLRLLVAAALFLALSALCLRNYYPPLAYPLTVDLVLDRGTVVRAGTMEDMRAQISGRWSLSWSGTNETYRVALAAAGVQFADADDAGFKRQQILDRRRVAMLADDGNGRESGRRRHAAD